MRELHYFGTWADSLGFMDRMFANLDVVVLADQWYERPYSEAHATLSDELQNALRKRPKFLVFRRGTKLQSSGFLQQRSGARAGMFSIDIALLAPGVECTLPADFLRDGKRWLNSGTLSYRREYYDEDAGAWRAPPADVKSIFQEVGQCIKQGSVQRRMNRTVQWCGHDAARLLDKGDAYIAAKGV